MNVEKELSPEMNSALQALALSNIEEGMGHNVTRAQGLPRRTCPKESLTPTRPCRGSGSEGARRVAGGNSGERDGTLDSGISPVPSTS